MSEPWPEPWLCIEAEVGTNRCQTFDTVIYHQAYYPGVYVCKEEMDALERVVEAAAANEPVPSGPLYDALNALREGRKDRS